MSSGPFLVHTSTNNVIPFNGASVFTIGRSGECNLDIAAIYISRKQCRIESLGGVGWALFDESRFRTTRLNGEVIEGQYCSLSDGDRISFAPNSASHEYTFHSNSHNTFKRKRGLDNELTQVSEEVKSNQGNERLSHLDLLREMSTQSSFSLLSPNRTTELEKLKKENIMLELELKRCREHEETNSLTVNLLETENRSLASRLEEVEMRNRELLEASGLETKRLETERLETDGCMSDNTQVMGLETQGHSLSQPMGLDSGKYSSCLREAERHGESRWGGSEGEPGEEFTKLKALLRKAKDEEAETKESLEDAELEIEALLKERCCKLVKYGSLTKTKNTSIDSLTELEMSLMKEDVKELSLKNSELSLNLERVSSEKDKFSTQLNDIIETELYCSICSDLIYQALTLQCRHTFCQACIEEWKKKKKECPVCRTKIKSQVPCLVIDNFIDKVAEVIGGELRSRRQEIVKERQAAAAAAATPRSNKRKRNNDLPPVPPFQALDPILEHLEFQYAGHVTLDDLIGGAVMGAQFMGGGPNLPQVVDLTNSPPYIAPFRGFQRHGRRRRQH